MGGITGVFFLQQADKLGIGSEVRAKAVLKPNGTGVADAVANGHAQYGVTLISEMLPNKDVTVWPLPDDLQMTTIYAAALATNAENAMDASGAAGRPSRPQRPRCKPQCRFEAGWELTRETFMDRRKFFSVTGAGAAAAAAGKPARNRIGPKPPL